VTERTEYTLVLLTCASIAHDEYIQVEMDVTMVNPNGQHLSIDKLPLEALYWALAAVYLGSMLVAVYSYATLLRRQILLQLLLGAVMTKWGEVLINLTYYRTLATTGRDYILLFQATKFGDVISNLAFMAFLLLVSLGWTITRSMLTRRERQLLYGFFGLYGIFGLLHSVCTTPAYCQSFLLVFYIVKFLITFCIIVAMNANIERLRAGTIDAPRPLTPTQLYVKLLIFHNMRMGFLGVLVFPIGLMFVEVAVLS
jgi:hypothetical protein